MKTKDTDMGRFTVDVEITNYRDIMKMEEGLLDAAKVRRKVIRGVVDSGAVQMVLPTAFAEELGLPLRKEKVKVRYADGRRAKRSEVREVQVRILGRDDVYSAILEPKRDTALVGAIVLEGLDFLVDCKKLCLVPRDPDNKVSEIE